MPYVMIVDDDEDFATAAATVLRNAGHEVKIELDTDGAMESVKERRPDLMVLDVMFPEDASGGFEMARTMHVHDEKLKDMPILMLTAVNARFPLGFSSRDIDDTWMPVTEFLEKPVDFDVLCDKVAALLEKAGSGAPGTDAEG